MTTSSLPWGKVDLQLFHPGQKADPLARILTTTPTTKRLSKRMYSSKSGSTHLFTIDSCCRAEREIRKRSNSSERCRESHSHLGLKPTKKLTLVVQALLGSHSLEKPIPNYTQSMQTAAINCNLPERPRLMMLPTKTKIWTYLTPLLWMPTLPRQGGTWSMTTTAGL